jgi:hypothetical protein
MGLCIHHIFTRSNILPLPAPPPPPTRHTRPQASYVDPQETNFWLKTKQETPCKLQSMVSMRVPVIAILACVLKRANDGHDDGTQVNHAEV